MTDRLPDEPVDPWQTSEVQELIDRQTAELSEAGMVLNYLASLYSWASQLEAHSCDTSGIVRETADLTGTLVAGRNSYAHDDGSDKTTDEYILVQVDRENGQVNNGSRITVGEIIGAEINAVDPPFSIEDLLIVQRHADEQKALGIEVEHP